jgi:hypothetical protein
LKSFAGQAYDVAARPVFAGGRPVGAVCLFGAPTGEETEDILADVAVMICRELDGPAGVLRCPAPARRRFRRCWWR